MSIGSPSRDLIPSTRTQRALEEARRDAGALGPQGLETPQVEALQAATCSGKRYVVVDPDAPNAPTCSGKRYIVVDPDAPDAPVCKPRRYIEVPDPETQGLKESVPAWARQLGESLAGRME
ncbi:MAG: hypothetical protein R3E10_07015 [Gemmatimonadota bacterium]